MESGANIGSGGYRHEVVSHDVDEFACSQPNWSLRYEQISTGRFLGKLQETIRSVAAKADSSSDVEPAAFPVIEIGMNHPGEIAPLRQTCGSLA